MKIINDERLFFNNPYVTVMTNPVFKKSMMQDEYSNLAGQVIQTLSDGYCLIRFSEFGGSYIDRYIHQDDFKLISIQNDN